MLRAIEVSEQVCAGFKVTRTQRQCACVTSLYSDKELKLPNGVTVGSQHSDNYTCRKSVAKAVLGQQNNSRRTARLAVESGALSVGSSLGSKGSEHTLASPQSVQASKWRLLRHAATLAALCQKQTNSTVILVFSTHSACESSQMR